MASKQEIKEFARKLYLEFDDNGERKNSFREISTIIQQKLNKTIHYSTIKNWADKDNWEMMAQSIRNLGIEKALKDKEDIEQEIIDKKSQELADILKKEKQTYNTANFLLLVLLNHYAEKAKEAINSKTFSPDMVPFTPIDLQRIKASALGNRKGMDPGEKENPIEELFRKLDSQI